MGDYMPEDTAKTVGGSSGAEAGTGTAFAVIHVRRTAPEEILIHAITATDAAAAREKTLALFGDITVLNVCRDETRLPAARPVGHRDFPSARFINGEFHAQTFSDEALLSALVD